MFCSWLEDQAGKDLFLWHCSFKTVVVYCAFHKSHMGNVFSFPVKKKKNTAVGNLFYNEQELVIHSENSRPVKSLFLFMNYSFLFFFLSANGQ